jgi:5-methylcytosine-specific restriction protein A
MPTTALRPCAEPHCPALVRKGRCKAHAVVHEQQRENYDIRRWYRTARWKLLRAQVLNENPLCVDCLRENRITAATDVHHKERHDGDQFKFWNLNGLEGLCVAHHSAKTARGE